jgi:hypothetical protein
MDTNKFSLFWESIRFIFGIGIITYLGNWFEIDAMIPFGTYLILAYLTLSLFTNIYFVTYGFKSEKLAYA